MATYRNVSEYWGDAVGGLTVSDYELQADAFEKAGCARPVFTADDRHIYADGVAVADAE